MVFPQQIAAALEIIAAFDKHTYAILLAQMQSGKTGTFMLVLSEMIRLGKVEYGVIFSGNREIELKEQTKNQDEFFNTYADYLIDIGITDLTIIDIIKTRFQVVWGPDLKNFSQKGNTIYIWEESHYGQSQKQQIDAFTTRLGIHPSGAAPEGCFVLSVSATPFSEYTDWHQMTQDKTVVRLLPPEQYLSVKKMIANKQLHAYTNAPKTKLEECLETHRALGYAIVRGMASELAPVANKHGWDVIHYDQSTSRGININDILSTRPLRPTVIFLKAMLRMGKQVKKQFLLFCLETSKTTKTDTVLQGLLGRCCGYDSSPSIHIYIRGHSAVKKIPIMIKGTSQQYMTPNAAGKLVPMWDYKDIDLVLEDIQRFIALHDNDTELSAPFRGANMTGRGSYDRTIPIKVTFTPVEWKKIISDTQEHNGTPEDDKETKGKEPRLKRKELIQLLKKINDAKRFENKNHFETQSEITRILDEEITGILEKKPTHVKIHYKETQTKPLVNHGGKTTIQALQNAFKGEGTPLENLGPGHGVVEDELVIFPDIPNKCLYIIFTMPSTIGETTKREVFSKKMPDLKQSDCMTPNFTMPSTIGETTKGEVFSKKRPNIKKPNFTMPDRKKTAFEIPDKVYTVNGVFGIKIPATIAIDADVFIGVISECVEISRGANHLLVPNFISPLKLGIFLTNDIFAKIQPGGEIYQALLKLGIVLHYKRAPGPRGTSGVRLLRISWIITDDTEHIPVATPLGTPIGTSLDFDCSTKHDNFHDDVPMVISVFTEDCDLDE
jgi:hypothetical protein